MYRMDAFTDHHHERLKKRYSIRESLRQAKDLMGFHGEILERIYIKSELKHLSSFLKRKKIDIGSSGERTR